MTSGTWHVLEYRKKLGSPIRLAESGARCPFEDARDCPALEGLWIAAVKWQQGPTGRSYAIDWARPTGGQLYVVGALPQLVEKWPGEAA